MGITIEQEMNSIAQRMIRYRDENIELRKQLSELSNAYVRLRVMIPGALDTPHAPTPETVWKITEVALQKALTK